MKKMLLEFINDFKELKQKKGLVHKLPSIITSIRLICTPLIPTFLALGNPLGAVIAAGLGSISDALDGFVARKFNASSTFGAKLDALCDKLFIASLTASLVIVSPLLTKMLGITILMNETIIAEINCQKLANDKLSKTTQIGRIKMVVLCIGLLISFLNVIYPILSIPSFATLAATIILQSKTIDSYLAQELEVEEDYEPYYPTNDDNSNRIETEKQLLYTLKAVLTQQEELEKDKQINFHL